ncbi:hypothetical protein OE88DRAFT_1649119 [Heliocybe sulcata]|uniref:Uncharacterized protein n=1 Tax=Heliocybe sulcata TaxID=5364 RepID=A0A5C3MMW4_9AGAM|nr:hypothetical protein OE88DRAFT_1649119 [Heliocybe sulcata]
MYHQGIGGIVFILGLVLLGRRATTLLATLTIHSGGKLFPASQRLFLDMATTTCRLRRPDLSDRVTGNLAQHSLVGSEASRLSSHSRSTIALNVLPVVPIITSATCRGACSGCSYASITTSIISFWLPSCDASPTQPTSSFSTTAPLFGNYTRHSSSCGIATSTQGLVQHGARTRLTACFKLGYERAHAGTAPQGDDRIGRRS